MGNSTILSKRERSVVYFLKCLSRLIYYNCVLQNWFVGKINLQYSNDLQKLGFIFSSAEMRSCLKQFSTDFELWTWQFGKS